MISYDEALRLIAQEAKSQSSHRVDRYASFGQVAAEDIHAMLDIPPFDNSAMDGYAIRYEDINQESLEIICDNPAGFVVDSKVASGVCIKTFTGSLMPKGSDTLVPIENVEVIWQQWCVSVDEAFIVIREFEEKEGINYWLKENTTFLKFFLIFIPIYI